MSRFPPSRFISELLGQVNRLIYAPFESLEELLRFYRRELPIRVGDYHLDEVGPVMHHERPGEAEKFLQGIFSLGEATMDMSEEIARRRSLCLPPVIDWYATPNGDLEWNGALARHGYLTLLGREYRRSRDERYARTVVEHLLDYIEGVPPIDPQGKPYLEYKRSTWRPFEVAGRVAETWPEALAAVIGSAAMTPEAWAVILLSVHEHALFLRRHHWRTGNHAALEVAALGILSIFYQEFREAEGWRNYARRFLERMWPRLFHWDGYSREMSGGYHWVALRSFFSLYEVACANNLPGLFSRRYRRRLARAALAELYQDKPDFSSPVSNDSNSGINRRAQLERLHSRLQLSPLAYRLSGGSEGRPARPASHFFPAAHLGIMRSDGSSGALYLFFDMGRWGDNHMNEDQLHVELSAYGRNLLCGCGRWRYTTSDPAAPWMRWARYFKSTAAYNSVLVDGWCQMPGDASGRMVIARDYDYAEGRFQAGYGEYGPGREEALLRSRGLTASRVLRLRGVVHTRRLFFLKPRFWLLRDEIDLRRAVRPSNGVGEGPRSHTVTQVWHFVEGELREMAACCYTTAFPDANLLLLSAGNNPLRSRWTMGQEQPIAGWHCPSYDRRQPAPELRFEQNGLGVVLFHTLLAPYRGGKPPSLPDLQLAQGGYRVRHWDGLCTVRAPARGAWSIRP